MMNTNQEHNLKLDIKSGRSEIPVHLIFVNTTHRDVDVFWVDYNSAMVHYRTLLPDEKMMVNTFKTHPWIFFDHSTGERMMVNHNEVYWPLPTYLRTDPRPRSIRRTTSRIHFPVRSLRSNALWSICKLISKESDIDDLEIPKSLKFELSGRLESIQWHQENRKKREAAANVA